MSVQFKIAKSTQQLINKQSGLKYLKLIKLNDKWMQNSFKMVQNNLFSCCRFKTCKIYAKFDEWDLLECQGRRRRSGSRRL